MTPKPGIPLNEPQTERCHHALRSIIDGGNGHVHEECDDCHEVFDLPPEQPVEREARGIPLIDVELLARAAAVHGIAVRDREGAWNLDTEWAEKVAAEYTRIASESGGRGEEGKR